MRSSSDVAALLANAEAILEAVEQSDIMQSSERREYPTFSSGEVQVGDVLGIGGFGIVSEVAAIKVQDSKTNTTSNSEPTNDATDPPPSASAVEQAVEEQDNESDDHHFDVITAKQKIAKRCRRFGQARYAIKRLDPQLSEMERTRGMIDMALEGSLHGVHAIAAWHCMTERCPQFSPLVFNSTIIFLLLSVKYLTVLWHPNIGKFELAAIRCNLCTA